MTEYFGAGARAQERSRGAEAETNILEWWHPRGATESCRGQGFEPARDLADGAEPSGQQGGSDEEGNGSVEDVEIACHGTLSEVLARDPKPIEGPTVASEGAKCRHGICRCTYLYLRGWDRVQNGLIGA
jgi:hypothetical protein